jgi:hypothetical protein
LAEKRLRTGDYKEGYMLFRLAPPAVVFGATILTSFAVLADPMSKRSMNVYIETVHDKNACSTPNKGRAGLMGIVEGSSDNRAAFYFGLDVPTTCQTAAGVYHANCERVEDKRWFCTHTKVTGHFVPD